MGFRPWWLGMVMALLFVAGGGAVRAELPVARLWTVFPSGAAIGSETEVTVTGVDLDDPEILWFAQQGIEARPKVVPDTEKSGNRKFLLKVGPEVPPGIYEARFIGRFGISNPRLFEISRGSELVLAAGEATPESPKKVVTGMHVSGRVPASAAVQLQIAAKKSERLRFLCLAPELDSRMEPVLVARDALGRELGSSRRGGWLEVLPKDDGDITLLIHDLTFRGGDEFYFRLHVGTASVLEYVFPPLVQKGRPAKIQVFGRGLDGASAADSRAWDGSELLSLAVTVNPETMPQLQGAGRFGRPVSSFGLEEQVISLKEIPAPFPLGLTTFPVVEEVPGARSLKGAQKVQPPCVIAGRFADGDSRSWFTFEARKGQIFEFDLVSHRLGVSTDPFMVVQRLDSSGAVAEEKEFADQETNIGGLDYSTSTRDPRGRFEVKEDGVVRLNVRNLARLIHGRRDPTYRLTIQPETPAFALFAAPLPPPPPNKDTRPGTVWTTHLRRGERTPVQILVNRYGGLTNAITVNADGLPSGVKAWPAVIPPDRTSGWLMLDAAGDCKAGHGLFRVTGRTSVSDREIVVQAQSGTVLWNVGDANNERIYSRLVGGPALSVSGRESAALGLTSTQAGTIEVKTGAKVKIPFRLERSAAYDRVVKVRPVGFALLENAKELEVPAKTNDSAFELDLAQVKLPAGEHQVFLEALSTGAYRRLVPDEVLAMEKSIKESEESLKAREKELTAAKEAASAKGAPDPDALKARVQQLEKDRDKLSAGIKQMQESIKPSDVVCRAWSAPINLKVIP